jgi:hypothetical protein
VLSNSHSCPTSIISATSPSYFYQLRFYCLRHTWLVQTCILLHCVSIVHNKVLVRIRYDSNIPSNLEKRRQQAMMDMDKPEEVTREETEDDHDDDDDVDDDDEKATAAGDGKEHAIHSLLAFSNSPSGGVQAVTTAESQSATTSSGSTHRREEQLLTNRISARDRRKRQKVANEYMKNENLELKAKLRQQDVEIKELKSRTENLEYALRQACIDNLTLLIAPTTGIRNSQQQQQHQQFNSSFPFPQQMQQNTQQERQQPGKKRTYL